MRLATNSLLMIPVKSIQEAERQIESIIKDIRNWMVKKKWKLNEDKTECMLFGTKHLLKKYDQISQIKLKKDNELKMLEQIDYAVKTYNYLTRNIAFIKKYLDINVLKTLSSNHILSRLDYCNVIYYALPKTLQRKLQRVRNSAAR